MSYTRHISRSIMLWLLALPVIATDTFRFELVPGTLLISWLLLGIDDIGMQLARGGGRSIHTSTIKRRRLKTLVS